MSSVGVSRKRDQPRNELWLIPLLLTGCVGDEIIGADREARTDVVRAIIHPFLSRRFRRRLVRNKNKGLRSRVAIYIW